jgi:hypothetical protein
VTHYGTLRLWALLLKIVGALLIISAIIGTIVAAVDATGVARTLATLLIGIPVSVFLATLPIALAQMMVAVADMGDALRGPGP